VLAARILESYLVLFLALAIVGSLPNTPKRLAMGIYIAIIVLTVIAACVLVGWIWGVW